MSVNVYDPINDRLIPVAGATLFAEMPLGAIQAFDSTDIPSNFLEFKGQTVNRADYPDLWAHIVKNSLFGEGKFYGIGDGSTTFTLADLRETSLKGYGETSRSVGAHVKSGGLGIGEFIDDQLQNHHHGEPAGTNNSSGASKGFVAMDWTDTESSYLASDGRTGATTEVKAVGVVWAVKAKMTGLPIDLKQQVDQVEEISGTTNGITYHVRKNNSVVCVDCEGTPTSPSGTVDQLLTILPQSFRPKNNVRSVLLITLTDTFSGTVNVGQDGRLILYVSSGTTWQSTNYGGSISYIN